MLRNLLTGILGLGLLAAVPASAMEIKISHQWRQGADSRDTAARLFAEEVTKRDPSITFRIYPGRSLIASPTKQIDALQDGTVEMSVYPLVYAAGKVPDFSITLMPGAFASIDEAVKLKNSPFYDKLQDIAMENGIRVMTWWWTPGGFATKDREVAGPDSVRGLKMRAADPYMEKVLQAMGASVVSMPSTEIYPAVQSGVLDGLMTSAESFISMRIYEQTRHATLGGDYTLFLLLQPLVMSRQHWEKLTDEQKKIFEEAATISEEFFNNGQKKANEEVVEVFEKNNNKVRQLTKAEYDAWVEKAKEVAWPDFAANTKYGKELLELVQAR